jgi:predicted kinase
MVLIVFGLPGSGKSFFASALSKALKFKYFNTDIIRREISAPSSYSLEDKYKVYDKMLELTKEAISEGEHVVLDGTFIKDALRKNFKNEILTLKQNVFFIEIKAEEETIKKRIAGEREFSEADLGVYFKLKNEFEPMREEHIILYSDKMSVEKMIERIKKIVESSEPITG